MKAALSSAVSLTHKDIDVAALHFQAPSLFWGEGGVGSGFEQGCSDTVAIVPTQHIHRLENMLSENQVEKQILQVL